MILLLSLKLVRLLFWKGGGEGGGQCHSLYVTASTPQLSQLTYTPTLHPHTLHHNKTLVIMHAQWGSWDPVLFYAYVILEANMNMGG